ncbi:hypothetical protein RJ640_015172 [Escallonia rubra]|uniref:SWIM-type domain-containing protein n=1 Tax=Escallonia rubra TaxID=112253 RepID=A0AA88RZS6_9ASTE|nr:hypothetical protein RJ640_015172 [Escallonia rubra]
MASVDCSHETLSKDVELTTYRVGPIIVEKEKWKIVCGHSSVDFRATCSCAKFETEGMLCKHILYIMKKKKLIDLPKHYIFPRWTIAARYKAIEDARDSPSHVVAQ